MVNAITAVKRKPLPKIYGCDGCGKKFDRPSTLKVHEAIHTGAKDHLCEYCIRAFTVQSNMKRHMRVCKHKPLSPPMALCYIVCTTPPLSSHHSLNFPPFFRGMDPVDGSNNLITVSNAPQTTSSSSSIIDFRSRTVIQTVDGSVTMLPFEHSYELPRGPGRQGPAPTVKGYKAPMVIAAMFSVQQNVPASVARLTLVHLECEIPLPPVTPHSTYAAWHSKPPGEPLKIDETDTLKAATEPPSSAFNPPAIKDSLASSSSSFISVASSVTLVDGPSVHPSLLPSHLAAPSSHASDSSSTLLLTKMPGVEDFDETLLTKDLRLLTDIQFEERNSFYPRSRYCYHPAEYDPIQVLPGPGVVALPSEDDVELIGSA